MEAFAAGIPLAVGAEALKILNRWLEDRRVAKAWYGVDNKKFTSQSIWDFIFRRGLRVAYVFTIKRDDWEQAIKACLPVCHDWYQDRLNGECCWLPLYRAVTTTSNHNPYRQRAHETLYSIGTVASLPTARLETWGLVVFGYADGGSHHLSVDGNGGYRARFDAKDFILVICRDSLNAVTTAHIAPRTHPNDRIKMPTDTEWMTLRRHGHSLEAADPLIRWFGYPCQLADPGDEILEGQLDSKIKEAIFDRQFAETTEEKLRKCIYKCYDNWTKHIREYPGNQFIKQEGETIRENLLKMRMLLTNHSWNSYCQEMTREDVLQYCTAQYQSIRHHIQQGNTDLDDLYMVHRQVLAFIKIFTLSKLIPDQLSTRNTGEILLLA